MNEANVFFQTGQAVQALGRKVHGSVKTQLIAHDKPVYDIAFTRFGSGRDNFATVGRSKNQFYVNACAKCVTREIQIVIFRKIGGIKRSHLSFSAVRVAVSGRSVVVSSVPSRSDTNNGHKSSQSDKFGLGSY